MGIRQQLNDNPAVAAGVVGVLVLVAGVVMFRTGCSRGAGDSGDNLPGVEQEFFTVDDGKSWFPADARKLPPFQHDGKPAYRVRVYRCPHGKDFAAHLERYADADRARLQTLLDETGDKPPSMDALKLQGNIEIKKPGPGDWIKMSPRTAAKFNMIRSPRCPEGSSQGLQKVVPG